MQKVDYLETKVNQILYELSYIKEENEKLKNISKNIQNENFLINSNFNINTNNNTFFNNADTSAITETVDKWFLQGVGSYTKKGELVLSKTSCFLQTVDEEILPNLLSKEMCLSFNLSQFSGTSIYIGANLYSDESTFVTFSKLVENVGVTSLAFNVASDITKIECFITSENVDEDIIVTPVWAKLELGTVFTNYIEPLPSIEMFKCNKNNYCRYEVVFDRFSSNPDLNWGYTKGIRGGDTVTGKDFSKYKQIYLYSTVNNDVNVFIIDLDTYQPGYTRYYGSGVNGRVDGSNYYHCVSKASISLDKTEIRFIFFKDTESVMYNDAWYCYKIIGIL